MAARTKGSSHFLAKTMAGLMLLGAAIYTISGDPLDIISKGGPSGDRDGSRNPNMVHAQISSKSLRGTGQLIAHCSTHSPQGLPGSVYDFKGPSGDIAPGLGRELVWESFPYLLKKGESCFFTLVFVIDGDKAYANHGFEAEGRIYKNGKLVARGNMTPKSDAAVNGTVERVVSGPVDG